MEHNASVSLRWLGVTWGGGGNVAPFIKLAQGLMAGGHAVEALASSGLGTRLAREGLGPVAASESWLPGAAEVLAAVERTNPDVLLVDFMLTGALCAALSTDRPVVALVHTLYQALLVDGAPMPMAMAGSVDQLNEVCAGIGYPAIVGYGDLLAASDLVVVTAPEELDNEGPRPEHLIYTGPLVEGPPDGASWETPEGTAPLVAVSLGTSGTNPELELQALRRLVTALGALPVRGVINLPDYIDADTLHAPANFTVTGFVHHSLVLPQTSLLVTHAGLGSISAALVHGVPMVCLPLDRDQPANARAVVGLGAGLALPPGASVEELTSAVEAGLRWPDRPPPRVDLVHTLDVMESVARKPD